MGWLAVVEERAVEVLQIITDGDASRRAAKPEVPLIQLLVGVIGLAPLALPFLFN